MQSLKYLVALAPLAFAYTKPTEATWGPLLKPDLENPVTAGETFKIEWDPETHPTDGVTVALVLCHGPSTNCVPSDTAIVEGVPAAQKSYSWDVPSDLEPGTASTETGYGMLIIVEATGEFQYSTQFSVLEGEGGKGGSSSSTTSKPTAGPTDGPSKTATGTDPEQTWLDDDSDYPVKNGTGYHGGKNGTTTSATATGTGSPHKPKPTTTFDVSTSVAVETASQPEATSPKAEPTPDVQTELSGAARNAVSALLFGAVAAAFML